MSWARGVYLRRWGVVKRRGDAWTLLCDFDSARPPQLRRIWRVLAQVNLRPTRPIEYHRTDRGWHVIIRVNRRLQCAQINMLQLLLGSDKNRERHNCFRILHGARVQDWNLLFDRKLI